MPTGAAELMRGTILDADSFERGDLDTTSLESALDQWTHHRSTQSHEVAERIAGCEVVVTNKVIIDAAAMQNACLKLIVVAATGTNNIDLVAAKQRNITVCNVRDYASAAVSQHVFSLLLTLVSHLGDYTQAVRTGRWQESKVFCLLDYPIRELDSMTLGIIGYGNLGRRVEQIALGFGMQVAVCARPGSEAIPDGRITFDELLKNSDVISLHCPLSDATHNLIGRTQLEKMKSTAILINTARGGIVNENDLANALRQGEIGGAGIDVLTQEPPGADHPLLAADIPNLVVSPHNAWGSVQSRQRLADEIADLIQAYRQETPRNCCLPD
jgi:glycerate dehydrogenase